MQHARWALTVFSLAVPKALEAEGPNQIAAQRAAETASTVDFSKPGTIFRDQLADDREGPEMVVIPAGRFMIGSPESDAIGQANESPQHLVTMKAFAMGRTEVTVAQFRQFVEATGYKTDAEKNSGCVISGSQSSRVTGTSWLVPGFNQSDDHPAVCLSANDALAYVEWLSKASGKPYRLPSEAQQEYTIRAGSSSRFAWGSDPDSACASANVMDQAADISFPDRVLCTDGHRHASPVASLRINAFGLFDTVGNAWEWSADCANDSYSGAPADGSVWDTGDCSQHASRGGSWASKGFFLRTAYRRMTPRDWSINVTGLRVIREH